MDKELRKQTASDSNYRQQAKEAFKQGAGTGKEKTIQPLPKLDTKGNPVPTKQMATASRRMAGTPPDKTSLLEDRYKATQSGLSGRPVPKSWLKLKK